MKRALAFTLAALAVAALAACGTSTSSGASAGHSALQSAAANPTVSADMATLETELLAAWKTTFSPAHPVKTSEEAIAKVFPRVNTFATASYAVQQLSTAMIGSSQAAVTARHDWAQAVVAKALSEGASPPASPSATVSS